MTTLAIHNVAAPATVDNPFTQVVDLTRTVPAEVLAVSVGAFVGVTLFIVMMLVFSRRNRRSPLQLQSANDVVFIPPRVVAPRSAPPPSIHAPTTTPQWPSPPSSNQINGSGGRFEPGFTPSSALSARALAKMGFAFGAQNGAQNPTPTHLPNRVMDDDEEELGSGELCVVGGTSPMPVLNLTQAAHVMEVAEVAEVALEPTVEPIQPITSLPKSTISIFTDAPATPAGGPPSVPAPVPAPLPSVECVFESTPSLSSLAPSSLNLSSLETQPASVVTVAVPSERPKLEPEPLAIIRSSTISVSTNDNGSSSTSGSGLMRAAPIAELDLDDAPTHLREPLFDEPPQPRRRSTPPKIRKIDPAPPRAYRPYQPSVDDVAIPTAFVEVVEEHQYQPPPRRGMLPRPSTPPPSGGHPTRRSTIPGFPGVPGLGMPSDFPDAPPTQPQLIPPEPIWRPY